MSDGYYSPSWEIVNDGLRRLKIPSGWIVVTDVHIIVGGKDYHAISQPLHISDSEHNWQIKS